MNVPPDRHILVPLGDDEDSNLIAHAKRELMLWGGAGYGDELDSQMNQSIVNMIRIFANQGHSGFSASICIGVLHELLQYKNLTPLTDDPNEWNEVGSGMWQNSRNSKCFSEDGGKTYTTLDERRWRYLPSIEPKTWFKKRSIAPIHESYPHPYDMTNND